MTQENYSRKKNNKIVGIKSQNNQGLEDSIIRVMRKVGINLSPRDIETANYITQDRRGENSPVIVRFFHWKDKQSIMTKKDRLRQDNISTSRRITQRLLKKGAKCSSPFSSRLWNCIQNYNQSCM